jgi:AcrR family transcriptional regulator
MDENRLERRKQRTRQQLKDAAVKLLMEQGYTATTIQAITDAADVGRGTFYLHFQDKQEIYAEILQDAFESSLAQSAELLTNFPTEQRDLFSFVAFFEYAKQQGGMMRAILSAEGNADLIEQIAQYTVRQAHVRLSQGGLFEDVDAEIAAQFMAGALMRVTRWWVLNTERYSTHEMAALFYRLLHRRSPPP